MSVSVVLPTWNRAATLEAAAVSALAESPAELVIVDDASTDETPEVAEALLQASQLVRYVRHEAKSEDWQRSLAIVYPTLIGSHVVCMGADDLLEPGLVHSINSHPHAAVVFHDYWVRFPDGTRPGAVTMGYGETRTLTPGEVCERLRSHPNATETGIGSGIRLDCLLWLASLSFWRMGPWSDAIGYAAVAARWGAVYVPGAGATFTDDPNGYGCQGRGGARRDEYHAASRRFLEAAEIDATTAEALCRQREIAWL